MINLIGVLENDVIYFQRQISNLLSAIMKSSEKSKYFFFRKFDSKIYVVAKPDLNSHGAMHSLYLLMQCEYSWILLQKHYILDDGIAAGSLSLWESLYTHSISTMTKRSENYEFQNNSGPKRFKEETVDLHKINHIRY